MRKKNWALGEKFAFTGGEGGGERVKEEKDSRILKKLF